MWSLILIWQCLLSRILPRAGTPAWRMLSPSLAGSRSHVETLLDFAQVLPSGSPPLAYVPCAPSPRGSLRRGCRPRNLRIDGWGPGHGTAGLRP